MVPNWKSHLRHTDGDMLGFQFARTNDQGIYNIQLADPTWDPHGPDGWNYVDDGIGCEGY